MRSVQLHERLVQALRRVGVEASKPQRVNLALLCQGLAVSPNCHLASVALGVPLSGNLGRVIQRLSRLLATEALEPRLCFRGVAEHVVRHWDGCDLNLVMDRTDLGDRWSVLTLGAAYHKRVLPLAWELLPFGGTGAEIQEQLLHRISPVVRRLEGVGVHFYADCEFRAVSLQQRCQQLGWHWQVGVKSDTFVRTPQGDWQRLRDLGLRRGERRYLPNVALSKEHDFGPVNLIADWSSAQEAPRYWALDRAPDGHAWRRGRKRFWIEPTFRDWKSYGFDLEHSKLDDEQRLNVLLLGIAVTTLWLIHLGDRLVRTGRDRLVRPHHPTDSSLFRLGRDYIQRARTLNLSIPVGFTVQHRT